MDSGKLICELEAMEMVQVCVWLSVFKLVKLFEMRPIKMLRNTVDFSQ